MQPAPAVQKLSMLEVVIRDCGPVGFIVLVVGLTLAVWGLANLVFVRNRAVLLAQVVRSFLPLLVGILGMGPGIFVFLDMVGGRPLPEALARTVVHSLTTGICASAATALSAVVGIGALARNLASP
jgi:hypothetical protein